MPIDILSGCNFDTYIPEQLAVAFHISQGVFMTF